MRMLLKYVLMALVYLILSVISMFCHLNDLEYCLCVCSQSWDNELAKGARDERDTARPLITLGWHILGTRCLGGWGRTSGWGLRFQPSQWRTPYTDGAKAELTHWKITTAHARVATMHRYVLWIFFRNENQRFLSALCIWACIVCFS